MSPKYLEIFKLSKAFPSPRGPVVIVKDFDLGVAEGEFISVIGHSGCGKSTVLSIVAGLTQATMSGIVLAGKEVTEAGPDVVLGWLYVRTRSLILRSDSFWRRSWSRMLMALAPGNR